MNVVKQIGVTKKNFEEMKSEIVEGTKALVLGGENE